MPKVSTLKDKKKVAVKRKVAAQTLVKKVKRKKVSAIPKGYANITPYLAIKDSAANAISFYKKVFGAKELKKMESPAGKILHAELKIGNAKIMLADEFPEMDFYSPKNYGGSPVNFYLYMKDVDSIVKIAVKNGAKLIMEVEDMFYGDRCGSIEDPFGHKWTVATHIEDVTPAKMKKRAAEMFNKKRV